MNERENFASKIGAVLATAGSAVGLGNIWRFPIETGRNGGAAFILVYIGCIVLMGIPVMLSEFLVGRASHRNATGAFHLLAPGTPWKWVGRLGVVTGFIVLSYYSVVAGWTGYYAFLAAANQFAGKGTADFPQMFSDYVADPLLPAVTLVLFLLLTHVVVVRGVTRGIERWSKILMPLLFVLLIVLVVCAVVQPGAWSGVEFIVKPDFSKVNGGVVLSAMGQAFFSLSLGVGCLCTYGSYFNRQTKLMRTTLSVCIIDTFVALMAGFIIFPAVATSGYQLGAADIGPSLIFITLPNVFQQAFGSMPVVCYVFSLCFYVLLILAALTSTISMHEISTSYLTEEYGISRHRAAWLQTIGCILVGVCCSLSFGPWKEVHLFGMSIFDFCDWLVSKFSMPIGSICMTLFVGWWLDKRIIQEQLTNFGTLRAPYVATFRFMVRYVTPLAVLLIFLHQFGLLSWIGL